MGCSTSSTKVNLQSRDAQPKPVAVKPAAAPAAAAVLAPAFVCNWDGSIGNPDHAADSENCTFPNKM